MIRLLFLGMLFITTIFADEIITTETNETNISVVIPVTMPKVLYLSYKEIPKKVIKGEIFTITVKTLTTVKEYVDINYSFSNYNGLKLLESIPYRDETSKYFYDTFYFLTTLNKAKIPDITASLISDSPAQYKSTTLNGEKIKVITLNPKENFSNIIANSLELIQYKTTSYDKQHNIIVFVITATNSDIKSINLNNVFKQGVESITESYLDSKITYYAVIQKNIQNFSFSYFNLLKNKFIKINIPIIVDDDSVTTQSDLKPKNQSHERIKMTIAATIALFGIIIIFWRKKYIYLIFILIPLSYIIFISLPSKEVCIKEASNIYLLPVKNATIFETTQKKIHLQKEGSITNFTKVKLYNNKIGWVKNEDICSY